MIKLEDYISSLKSILFNFLRKKESVENFQEKFYLFIDEMPNSLPKEIANEIEKLNEALSKYETNLSVREIEPLYIGEDDLYKEVQDLLLQLSKKTAIPNNEQIEAMLNGTIYELLKKYYPEQDVSDFRAYFTVTRKEISDYFKQKEDKANLYLDNLRKSKAQGLGCELRYDDKGYYLISLNKNNEEINQMYFKNASDAIAEYIFTLYDISR